jgi:DNA polymerase-1
VDLVTSLRQAGVARGDLVGLVISPGLGLGVATAQRAWLVAPGPGAQPAAAWATEVVQADEALRPRWVVWSGQTAARLAADGVRLATCWDIAAAHRLLFGGWRADPGWAWARLQRPGHRYAAGAGPLDLFGIEGGDADDPVAPDGHLRPEWVSGGWSDSLERIARWAELARTVAGLQHEALAALAERPMALATARCESTAELLCAELSADGLPMDRAVAEQVLAGFIGPRPRSEAEAVAHPGRPRRGGAAARPGRRRRRPAQPGSGTDAAQPGRGRRARHPGLAAAGAPGRPSAGRRPCLSGARRSGSPPRTATPGWMSTSGPTAGCAARGPARTVRRAG